MEVQIKDIRLVLMYETLISDCQGQFSSKQAGLIRDLFVAESHEL